MRLTQAFSLVTSIGAHVSLLPRTFPMHTLYRALNSSPEWLKQLGI